MADAFQDPLDMFDLLQRQADLIGLLERKAHTAIIDKNQYLQILA